MKLLVSPRAPMIDVYYEKMVESVGNIAPELKGRKHLREVDFEAIHDLMHGLTMTVLFTDDTRFKLNHDRNSFRLLLEKLKTVNVSQVIYSQQTLEKVRAVLREACLYVNASGCDSYDNYLGLIDNRARIFSRSEEQGIKWAILYQLPNNFTAAVLKETGLDSSSMDRRIEFERKRHLEISKKILQAVFSPGFADRIYDGFAQEYISQEFARVKGMVQGNVVILTR